MKTFREQVFEPDAERLGDMILTDLPIEQFAPANGWLAVTADADQFAGELRVTPVVGWGVIRSGRGTAVVGVIRTKNGSRLGIAENDWGTLVGYCRVGEDHEALFGDLGRLAIEAELRRLSEAVEEELAEEEVR